MCVLPQKREHQHFTTCEHHTQHLTPLLLLPYSCTAAESLDCNDDKDIYQQETAADLWVWTSSHEYRPSSPEHAYKSPPYQRDKSCLPLKNQQLFHFPLLCHRRGPIILCDYAAPCIGDNVRRVNTSYRLSSLAGAGPGEAPARPSAQVSTVELTSVSRAGGSLWMSVCV